MYFALVYALLTIAVGGCPHSARGDGNCDRTCMTPSALFDGLATVASDCDAQCAIHCDLSNIGNGACDPQCNTWDCRYDSGDCGECAPGCNSASLADGNCDTECNVSSCSFDFGDCSNPGNSNKVYVSSLISTGGDGGRDSPFASFAVAAESLWLPFSSLLLLKGEHTFSPHTHPTLLSSLALKETIIATVLCTDSASDHVECSPSPAVIKLTSAFLSFTITHSLIIDSVSFVGGFSLVNGCILPTCTYCPYVILDTGLDAYMNDKNEMVNKSDYADQKLCAAYNDKAFINLFRTGQVAIRNSSFKSFRHQLGAIIQNECGDITLDNVEFDNNIPTLSGLQGGLIRQSVPDDRAPYNCGNFTFSSGKVSRMNNGYEYRSDIVLSGFLEMDGLYSFHVTNVTFEFNFLPVGESVTTYDSTMMMLHRFRTARVSNCTFRYNVAKFSVALTVINFIRFVVVINKEHQAIERSLTHLALTDLRFENNTSTYGTALYVHFQIDHQNVVFDNSTLINNFCTKGPLIYIQNDQLLPRYADGEDVEYWYIDQFVSVWIPPRYVNVSGLVIQDNYATAIGWFRDIGNVFMHNITIRRNGESLLDISAYDYVITEYFRNPDNYLSEISKSGIGDFRCQNALTFATILKISIEDMIFAENNCPTGSPGIAMAASPRVLSFRNVSFTDSSGSRLLTLTITTSLSISHFTFRNNTNLNDSNAVSISIDSPTPNDIVIEDSTFQSNSGDSAALGIVLNVKSLLLSNTVVEDQSVKFSGAGLLFSPYPYGHSALTVSRCRFLRNRADSEGVVTILDFMRVLSGNKEAITLLSIADSSFEENESYFNGAGITVDNFIHLSPTSAITNCTFLRNNSERGASIIFLYQTGVVTISNSTFANNTASEGGAGVFAKQFEDSESAPTYVVIRHSVFTGSVGAAVSVSGYAKVSSLYSEFNRFQENWDSAVTALLGLYNDRFSVYIRNVADYGPAVSFKSGSIGTINSAVFARNRALVDGGAVYTSLHSVVSIMNSSFTNNTADGNGGVLFSDSSFYTDVENSTFEGNTAQISACVFFIFSGTLRFHRSTLKHNSAKEYALGVTFTATLIISSSTIDSNFAAERSSGVILSSSVLNVSDSTFQSQAANDGGFVLGLNNNYVTISSSVFVDGKAAYEGGAIYITLESDLQIYSSRFERCTAGTLGGAIFIGKSSFSGEKVEFVDTAAPAAGAIGMKDGQLRVAECTFERVRGSAIRAEGATAFFVVKASFKNAAIFAYRGAAIYILDSSPVTISDSLFTLNSAEKGGAVYIYASVNKAVNDQSFILRNTFESNWAATGGALGVDGVDLVLEGNVFENNTSIFIEGSLAITNGDGGAVNVRCDNPVSCSVRIHNNTFSKNTAQLSGGAVRWQETVPVFEGNEYEDNSAVYGENTASYAIALAPVSVTGQRIEYLDNATGVPTAFHLTKFASGQQYTPTIRLGLFDHASQLVTIDNSSSIELAGSENVTISGSLKDISRQGIFYLTDFAIVSEPGTIQVVTLITNGVDMRNKIISNDSANYIDVVSMRITFRLCELGESLSSNKACVECPAETYSLDPEKPCKTCLSSAICYGGFAMVPRKGFWRDSNSTDTFFECLNAEACVGSPTPPDVSLTGLCADGYSGNLCQVCLPEYSRTGRSNCSRCPNLTANVSVSILIILVSLCGLTLVITFAIRGATRPRSLMAIYFKIFLNYMQMVVVAASLNLNWPSFVKTFLSSQELAGGVAEQLFSFECLMKDFSPTESVGMYTSKLIMSSLLPLALMLISLLGWSFMRIIKQIDLFIPKLIASFVIIEFVLHPSITKIMFSIFSCMEIAPGEKWIIADLSQRCWTATHIRTVILVSVPSLVVWVLGLPTIVLGLLIRSRRGLADMACRLKFSFLYKGYELRWFFWEFVILYRKVAIVSSSVFLSPISIKVESLTILAILLAAIYLQLRHLPFNDPTLNRLEVKSILVSAITIYAGLYFDTHSMSNFHTGAIINVLLFGAIIVSNGYFLATWLVYISPVVISTIRERWRALTKFRKNYRVHASAVELKDVEKPDVSQSSSFGIASSAPFEHTGNPGEQIESLSPPPENTPVRLSREFTEPFDASAQHISFRDKK